VGDQDGRGGGGGHQDRHPDPARVEEPAEPGRGREASAGTGQEDQARFQVAGGQVAGERERG